MSKLVSLALASSLVCACTAESSGVEETPTGSSQSAVEVVGAFTVSVAGIVEISAPLAPATAGTNGGGDGQGGDDGAAGTLGDIMPETCVIASYTLTTATFVFEDCPLGTVSITGTLTVGIELAPVFRLFAQAADLQIGPVELNGTIGIASVGPEAAPEYMLDVSGSAITGQGQLDIGQFDIRLRPGQDVIVDGNGYVETANVSANVNAAAVTYLGACHPESGTISFDDGSGLVTATFLSETPITGNLDITIAGVTTRTPVLSPCVTE